MLALIRGVSFYFSHRAQMPFFHQATKGGSVNLTRHSMYGSALGVPHNALQSFWALKTA